MSDTTTPKSMLFETQEEWHEFYENFGKNGRTFQDFTNLTPQSMEVIYMVAYNQFNAGKYDEAEKVFQLLSVMNHFDPRFWTGLGASREMQKKFDEAIKAYAYLTILDLENPTPALLTGKCNLAAGRQADAESAFHACVFICKDKLEHAEVKAQAQSLLELLAKNQPAS
jgi:type III secretion system low calcium response chaperone LcrH/SycD